MNILIMGPAGSGKGTMSDKIIQKYGVAHISTGDMLREAIKAETNLGLEAKKFMDAGKLVPDDVVIGMVEERIQKPDCEKGYLMDGFPRTLAQAKAFKEITDKLNRPTEIVIDLQVPFEELANRITGRRICKNCGAIYHIKNKPPKVDGICDVCSSPLVQRSDDTIEQLKVRMEEYEKNTKPVIDFYKEQGLVKTIDASSGIDTIWDAVDQALGKI